jgi:DNA-binding Xre family transcriptional regulator
MKSERGHEVAATEESALVLKAAELRRGRSLSEVAQIVGIRPEELSKIEAGKTKQIRWVTLLGLTRAYDCSLGDLLEVRTKENDEFPERAAFLAAAKARTHKPTIRRLVRREDSQRRRYQRSTHLYQHGKLEGLYPDPPKMAPQKGELLPRATT